MEKEHEKAWWEENHSVEETMAAAELGNLEAMWQATVILGQYGFTEDPDGDALMVKYLQILTDNGDPTSMIRLAGYFLRGDVVEKNVKKALQLFAKGGKSGCLYGYECLGITYCEGDGVKRDYAKAWNYLQKATYRDEEGEEYIGCSPGTWYTVGEMYRNGWHVAQDLIKAKEYYERALQAKWAKEDGYYWPCLFRWAELIIQHDLEPEKLDEAWQGIHDVAIHYTEMDDGDQLEKCVTAEEIEKILV